MTPEIAVQWITEEAEFLALRDQWNRLTPTARGRDVFLRHEWFDAAWRWRGGERCALRVALVMQGARLVGVCPLVLLEAKHGGIPTRRLEFLTVPDTQCCDVVCAKADAATVCAALAHALRARASEWDVLELKYLFEDAAAMALLEPAARTGLGPERLLWDANAYIDLDETWDDFYGRRSRSLKKANNLAANRLRKAGNLELQWMYGGNASRDEAEAVLAELIAVSARSWKAGTGLTLDNAQPGAFIRRLTHHARDEGWLSLWCLRLDGRPTATEYQLACCGEAFALRADFDQALETISPGSYLSVQMLQQLFASGLRRYWLGPGQNAYKARWTDRSEALYRFVAYSPTVRGRILRMSEQVVRPFARKVRAAWRHVWRVESDSTGADK